MKNVKYAIIVIMISVCYVAFAKATTGDADILDFFAGLMTFTMSLVLHVFSTEEQNNCGNRIISALIPIIGFTSIIITLPMREVIAENGYSQLDCINIGNVVLSIILGVIALMCAIVSLTPQQCDK